MGTASSRRSSATGRGCYKSDKGAGLAAGDIRFANDPAIPVAVECTPSKGIPFVVLRFFAPCGDNIFEENMTLKFTRDADCAFFQAFVTFVVRDSNKARERRGLMRCVPPFQRGDSLLPQILNIQKYRVYSGFQVIFGSEFGFGFTSKGWPSWPTGMI